MAPYSSTTTFLTLIGVLTGLLIPSLSTAEPRPSSAPIVIAGPAEPLTQCQELVKECLMVTPKKKSQCFFSRGQHPFCEGTSLGKLSITRWSLSPQEEGEVLALTGPKQIDQSCIASFDRQLAAALHSESSSPRTFKVLLEKLKRCEITKANPIPES